MKKKSFIKDPEELVVLKKFYRLLFEKDPNHNLLMFAKFHPNEINFMPNYAKKFVNEDDTSPTQGYVRYTSALESALRE